MKRHPHPLVLSPLLSLAVITAIFTSRLSAENVITVGYGEGKPGDNNIHVMITASNDLPIHGYSLALTYASDALQLRAINTAGTYVGAEVEPDFSEANLSQPGVGVLGVIFSFSESGNIELKELPALPAGSYPRIIARLTFNVKATALGGTYPLELRDGIGTPASFNRFTRRGTSITPRLVSGNFRIEGGNSITLQKKLALPGSPATIPVLALLQHPEAISGFQIAFSYEKSALTLPDLNPNEPGVQNATYTGTSLDLALGDKVEAYSFDVDMNYTPKLARASLAVLFELTRFTGLKLAASTANPPSQSVAQYTFQAEAAADDERQWQDLTLEDLNLPGFIDNRIIVDDRSLDPSLNHGKIYFSLGNLVGRIVDSETKLDVPGVTVITEPDGYTTTTDASGQFRFDNMIPGRQTLLVAKTTSPATYYKLRHFQTETGGDIVVEGLNKVSSVGTLPIYPIAATPLNRFLRGRVNEDNKVDLSDSVTLLRHLFQGGAEPPCQLAADTNDDNKLDISDGVFLLAYLFTGGRLPPEPFAPLAGTSGCGDDPTPGGTLGCKVSSCFGG